MSDDHVLRPTFIVIGAQKAGTTALHRYLSTHPDVAPPLAKEINFFMCASLYAQGTGFYHAHFPTRDQVRPGQVTFEASPNYLLSSDAPQRMYDYNPNIRLIALLRDPALRAYSAWHMYRRFFRKKPNWYFDWMITCDATIDTSTYVRRTESFGESLIHDILQEHDARQRGVPIEAPFLRHGFYGDQLSSYLSVFPRAQIFIDSSDRFRSDTAEVLTAVESYLGLSPYNWSEANLSPVFVGDYTDEMPADARQLLSDIYRASNEKVYQITGSEYQWA